jgi:hypothetical protein
LFVSAHDAVPHEHDNNTSIACGVSNTATMLPAAMIISRAATTMLQQSKDTTTQNDTNTQQNLMAPNHLQK